MSRYVTKVNCLKIEKKSRRNKTLVRCCRRLSNTDVVEITKFESESNGPESESEFESLGKSPIRSPSPEK